MLALPFPDKVLWPNGRGHWSAKSRAFKKHKRWAYIAALAVRPPWVGAYTPPIQLHYRVTPKTAHAIDADNAVAAMKAYQDGIALALGVDDSTFAVPTVTFAAPAKPGRVKITIGGSV